MLSIYDNLFSRLLAVQKRASEGEREEQLPHMQGTVQGGGGGGGGIYYLNLNTYL